MSEFDEVVQAISTGKKFYLTRKGIIALVLIPFLVMCGAITYAELKPAKVVVETRVEVSQVPIYRYLPKDSKETPLIDADAQEKDLFLSEDKLREGATWLGKDELRVGEVIIKVDSGLYRVKYYVIRGELMHFWEWRTGKFHQTFNWEMIW
jgi:hypothetical protein